MAKLSVACIAGYIHIPRKFALMELMDTLFTASTYWDKCIVFLDFCPFQRHPLMTMFVVSCEEFLDDVLSERY